MGRPKKNQPRVFTLKELDQLENHLGDLQKNVAQMRKEAVAQAEADKKKAAEKTSETYKYQEGVIMGGKSDGSHTYVYNEDRVKYQNGYGKKNYVAFTCRLDPGYKGIFGALADIDGKSMKDWLVCAMEEKIRNRITDNSLSLKDAKSIMSAYLDEIESQRAKNGSDADLNKGFEKKLKDGYPVIIRELESYIESREAKEQVRSEVNPIEVHHLVISKKSIPAVRKQISSVKWDNKKTTRKLARPKQ